MDKMEMYVRMCDCEEVQEQWEPEPGGFISHAEINPVIGNITEEITQLYMCSEWGKETEECKWGEKITWIEYEGHDYIAKFKNLGR